MPSHHMGYSSLLQFSSEYENWVMRFMDYSRENSVKTEGDLEKLIQDAENLRIDTEDILVGLKADLAKYDKWKHESLDLANHITTVLKEDRFIDDLDSKEIKLQALIDQKVSSEYHQYIKQLKSAKWLIKVYRLIKLNEQIDFKQWRELGKSEYKYTQNDIPTVKSFKIYLNQAELVDYFVNSAKSITPDEKRISILSFRAFYEDAKETIIELPGYKEYLRDTIKTYEQFETDFKNIRAGISYLEL